MVANLTGQNLQTELRNLEEGGVFQALGFQNLLEGDFFRWYVDAWSIEVEAALRLTLARLADYNPATTQVDPYAARDLLKKLYHYLLPRAIRHDLGEYYTPDWLASRVLTQLGSPLYVMPEANDHPVVDFNQRLLDPACGSGTFLVLAIRAIKEHARRRGLGEAATLEAILRGVVGVDLNPLAVLAARVGYLLAIADLAPYRTGPISIPVYLADSILAPDRGANLFEHGQRVLDTVVGRFAVPARFDSADTVASFTSLLYYSVENGFSEAAFSDRLRHEADGLTDVEEAQSVVLFRQLADLKQRGMDGVWARVIKNAFMPLFIGEFDFIAGNPPWVNWEYLPTAYRELSRPLWQRYQLLPTTAGRIGSRRVDISTLLTYAVVDRHLKRNGKLAFVITESVFKTGASAGFRRFTLPDGMPLRVLSVDDMTDLQPFEGASNRTAVFVMVKGAATRYPLGYVKWRRRAGARRPTYDSTLPTVEAATTRSQQSAAPVDPEDASSVWLTAPGRLVNAVRRVLGASAYTAHVGVYSGGANGVYWVDRRVDRPDGLVVIQNIVAGARREVEEVTAEVEADLLYPLLRPRDLRRWASQPSAHILMVWDPEGREFIGEQRMQTAFPHAFAYLNRFRGPLI